MTEDVLAVTIEAEPDFRWAPGQYVALRAVRQPEMALSYYSIASCDSRFSGAGDSEATEAPARFELAVNGASVKLGAPLEVGLGLELAAPGGGPDFDRLQRAARVVLIGMGTGVAPLRAVIQGLLASGVAAETPHITLLQGARTVDTCLYMEELNLTNELDYHPTLTRTAAGTWSGRTGRVQAHVAELFHPEADYCICGSKVMVADVSAQLAELDVPADQIFAEGY